MVWCQYLNILWGSIGKKILAKNNQVSFGSDEVWMRYEKNEFDEQWALLFTHLVGVQTIMKAAISAY